MPALSVEVGEAGSVAVVDVFEPVGECGRDHAAT